MKFDLDQNGDPQSHFMKACEGRRIDLAGLNVGPHPIQIIPSQWRTLGASLTAFVDELATAEAALLPESIALLLSFRSLVYDATELFDSYALLVPSRVARPGKAEKVALSDYKRTVKRLRDDCAQLCNRCKHNGAQLKFLWARSPSNGLTGSRVLVCSYYGSSGLLRDDTVHKDKMGGIGLVRWAQELAHNLLRIDRAAGILVGQLAETATEPIQNVQTSLPVGAVMRQLVGMRATRHADEPAMHDSLSFSEISVLLVRSEAEDFGPSATIVTTLTIENGTTTYSVA